ncbi:DHA2 family efflux MFS transporter permease subunit [Nocardia farcinica]|uniref:DHA2 family efflux MFS transporter permease subunit n=1 Tax=Nocardia farcinica TaxID=37329 RepID=UPI002457797F|nr:DHA2 family efflux MFS transporter permease subunit [Nocardia farcinica]
MATVGAETATRRSAGAIWTLVVVALATFMLMLDLTVVNVALPDIRAAFGSSFSALQWILDAYALGLAAVLLAAGSLADRLGRKRVFDAGLVIFVLSSLACGLAPNDLVLIVARFVQGLGGAILFAVGPALLGHEFRGKDRGMAFGVFGGVTGLAIAFGPLIGGGLTETAGWRWIFLINVPVTIAALVIGYLKVRESRSDTPPPVDWPGMITFSAGLFFLVLGFMRGEQDGWTSLTIIGCFALAVVLLAVFTRLQITRPGRAMFDLSLFGSRTFNGLSAVTALCALTVMPALFLLISYVQNMLGYSAFASGLRFLPLTLLLFVAAAVAGSLVTKLPPAVLVGVSQLLIAGGLLAVVLVDVDSAWTALIPAMILIGLGMGVFNPPRAAFSIAVTTPDKSGMASGINETFQQAGVAIGIAAVGAFFQNRVAGAFTETDTARRVFGEQVDTAGDAVAAAGPSAVLDGLPASVSGAVRAAAETAFVDGLRTAMVLAAVLAAVSGVIAFCTMRRSDLDPAALENPGVPADAASADVPTTPMPVRMAKHPGAVAAAQRAAQIIAEAKAEAQRVIGIDNAGDTGRTATDARTAGKPDLGKGTRRTGAADRAGTAGRTTAASRTRTTDVDGAAEPRARRGRASSGNGAGNGAELRPGARKSASPGEPAGRSSASASAQASASAERTRSGGPRSGNAGQSNRTTGTDTEHTRQTTRRTRESARTTGSRTTAGDATRAAESATANEPSTPTRSTNGTRTARSSSNPARTTPAGDPTAADAGAARSRSGTAPAARPDTRTAPTTTPTTRPGDGTATTTTRTTRPGGGTATTPTTRPGDGTATTTTTRTDDGTAVEPGEPSAATTAARTTRSGDGAAPRPTRQADTAADARRPGDAATAGGAPTTRRTNATDAQRTAGTGSERVADSTPTGSGSTPAESAGTGPAGATAESDSTSDGNGGVGQRSRSTGGNGATGGRHARTSGTATDRPRATVGSPSAADRKSARMTGDRGAREPQKTAAPENRGNSGRFAPSAAHAESATEQPRAETDSAPVAGRAAQTAAATGTPAPRTTAPRTSGGAGRHARATRTRTTAGKQSGKDGDNTADLGTSPDDNQTPAGTTAEARNQTAPGQTAANQAAPDQPAPDQPAPNQPAPNQPAPGQVESASATPKDASHAASTAPSTPASAPGTASVTPADATAESPAVATTAPTTGTKRTRTRRTTRGSSTTAAKAAATAEQVPATAGTPADSATPAETTAPAPQPAPEQPAAPAKSSASTKPSPSAAKSTPTKSAATKSTPTKSGAAKSTTPKATAAKSTARKRPAAKSTGADSATGAKSSTAQKSTRSTRARSDDTGSAPEN